MTAQSKDLWSLVRFRPQVDPQDLAKAIQEEVAHGQLDYRTRLLVHDALGALRQHWPPEKWENWLANCPQHERIELIWRENFAEAGFPSLVERVVQKIDPEEVRRFFRELGSEISGGVRLVVGGSIALILPGYVTRGTEDIDVVDEVPESIRAEQRVLSRLRRRYGLQLTHFQSHYLPLKWQDRLHSLGAFGQLSVYLVDVYDIFLSKLFSGREKDRDDLRALAPQLSKETLVRRLHETSKPLLKDARLRSDAEQNWYILFGEPLPSEG